MTDEPANQPEEDLPPTLKPFEIRLRKREWNRGPIQDLFPRIPPIALERVLDVIIDKNFFYNLSESKFNNSRKYTSIIIAHIRHFYTSYDALLRAGTERFAARKQTAGKVWTTLREWCPWDGSNEVLRRCYEATLLSREERDTSWDPMDIDEESEDEKEEEFTNDNDDPMDLD